MFEKFMNSCVENIGVWFVCALAMIFIVVVIGGIVAIFYAIWHTFAWYWATLLSLLLLAGGGSPRSNQD